MKARAARLPLESLKVMLSECMTGKRRTSAEEKVLGFYHISRAHFHSPARRTIVIKVPREDDDGTSVCAVLDKAMYGTKDAAQCFDVASENAMTALAHDAGKFSPCLYHSSAVAMSLFRHGDDFVDTRTQHLSHPTSRVSPCVFFVVSVLISLHAQHLSQTHQRIR